MKINFRKLLIEAAVEAALIVGVLFIRGIADAAENAVILQICCDAFFVVGALFIGFGLLVWMANDGAFNSIGFVSKTLLSLKWSTFGNFKEEYLEYCERKNKAKSSFIELIILGAAAVVIAGILLAVYNRLQA